MLYDIALIQEKIKKSEFTVVLHRFLSAVVVCLFLFVLMLVLHFTMFRSRISYFWILMLLMRGYSLEMRLQYVLSKFTICIQYSQTFN